MAARTTQQLLAITFDAAAQLVLHGWTQGAYHRTKSGAATVDGTGDPHRVDLAYALDRAARAWGMDPEVLRRIVQAELPEPFCSDDAYGLERWNDVDYRARSEVLMVLRRCRDQAEG